MWYRNHSCQFGAIFQILTWFWFSCFALVLFLVQRSLQDKLSWYMSFSSPWLKTTCKLVDASLQCQCPSTDSSKNVQRSSMNCEVFSTICKFSSWCVTSPDFVTSPVTPGSRPPRDKPAKRQPWQRGHRFPPQAVRLYEQRRLRRVPGMRSQHVLRAQKRCFSFIWPLLIPWSIDGGYPTSRQVLRFVIFGGKGFIHPPTRSYPLPLWNGGWVLS